MNNLTNDQWARYEERYGKLMRTISFKISGDLAIANPEDNYSDLCIAAIESINAFKKKTDKGFDEAFDTKLFDQYTKTVLWNRKAKKGIPLSKRMEFRNRHVSMNCGYSRDDIDLLSLVEDPRCVGDVSSVDWEDFTGAQEPNLRKIVNAVIKDPSMLSKEGKINYSSLVKSTGLSIHFVKKAVDKIKFIFKEYSCG